MPVAPTQQEGFEVPIQGVFDYVLGLLSDSWPKNDEACSDTFTRLIETIAVFARSFETRMSLTEIEIQAYALAWVLGEMALSIPENDEDKNSRWRAQRLLWRLQGRDDGVIAGRA